MRAARLLALLPGLLLLALLAACGGGPAGPVVLPPLRYDYLMPLRLNVADIQIEDHAATLSPADVSTLSPETPAAALRQMAQDRLVAAGSSGRAVFIIQNASIIRAGNTLQGNLAVRLDIIAGDGTRTGYAEARVSRIRTLVGGENLTAVLYDMTRQMMDDMNVEFEYQVRNSLKNWLIGATPSVLPTPVEEQPLEVPPGTAAPAPSAPAPQAAPPGVPAAPVPAAPVPAPVAPGLSPPPHPLALPPGMLPAR